MLTLTSELVSYTQHLEALTRIDEASAVICQRELTTAVEQEVAHLLHVADFTTLKLRAKPAQMYALLQENLPTCPHLTADIQACVATFAEATGCRQVDIQLSAIAEDMCRKFHVDRVDFRLLCSYAGIGTYFILPEQPETAETFEQVKVGEVIIFRGLLSASNTLPALLHKSPPAKQLNIKRLLLRLDTNF